MKVKDLMTYTVNSCEPDTNLAAAAMMMWDGDCGVLPVVDHDGKVIGVLTDRDITMAVATQNKAPSEIQVNAIVEKHNVAMCSTDDDVKQVLQIMADCQIRRVPVVEDSGKLEGIFSLNDAIHHAKPGNKELSEADVMETMRAICAPRVMA